MGIELAQNTVIAERFRLNRLLGRGGMGSVWHATHLGLDIPCAVKFIEGEFAALPEAQARFEREAKAAAALRSPHVVQILDHGVCQGTPYIAMELLDGEDLGKRLQKVGRLGSNELNTVFTQVCRALTKAHSQNIVHRDLKPDNIFLVKDDDREIAKVLDFGIAKANANAIEGSNTKTGAMLGTPYYMSPEQAQGTKSVDWRSDLWSLAVIAFQCVTGKLPFESEALGDLLVKIIVNPIPVPSQVAPDVPASFDKWWARAAARDPAQRFQSAKEFSDSLGLVWGLSQMTDVMDRNAIRAQLAGAPQGAPMMHTPSGYGAQPGMAQTPQPQGYQNTPHPQFQNTPQPGGMGMQNTPQPGMMHQTPQPMMGTPAPVAHTYNGTAPIVPKKGSGTMIALAVVGVFVLGGAGVAVALAMKGGGGGAASQKTASAKPSAAPTTPSATTAAADPPAATATAIASATAPAASSAAPVAASPVAPKVGGAQAPAPPKAPAGGGAAKPPPPPGKPKDLGF